MSKPLWLIFISLALAGTRYTVNSTVSSKGNRTELEYTSRIIGGSLADGKKYTFMVSIQRLSFSWAHHCGGSIVKSNVVLTACHCLVTSYDPKLVYRDSKTFRVLAGASDLRGQDNPYKQVVYAKELEVHPQCGGEELLQDTGVIILKKHLQFNDFVKPLKLFSSDALVAREKLISLEEKGAKCYNPGWGSIRKEKYVPSFRLKVLPVYLTTSAECNWTYCKLGQNCGTDYMANNQVCAVNKAGTFCHGDSGGPLVCRGYVFGVVSYSYGCNPGWPMVFSDVTPVLDIINKHIHDQ